MLRCIFPSPIIFHKLERQETYPPSYLLLFSTTMELMILFLSILISEQLILESSYSIYFKKGVVIIKYLKTHNKLIAIESLEIESSKDNYYITAYPFKEAVPFGTTLRFCQNKNEAEVLYSFNQIVAALKESDIIEFQE